MGPTFAGRVSEGRSLSRPSQRLPPPPLQALRQRAPGAGVAAARSPGAGPRRHRAAREHRGLLPGPQSRVGLRRVQAARGRGALAARHHRRGVRPLREVLPRLHGRARREAARDRAQAHRAAADRGPFHRRVREDQAPLPRHRAGARAHRHVQLDVSRANPHRYRLVATTNLFGDILSDQASGLAGGIGLAPSLNAGLDHAMAQAVHGTAPDIAGRTRRIRRR